MTKWPLFCLPVHVSIIEEYSRHEKLTTTTTILINNHKQASEHQGVLLLLLVFFGGGAGIGGARWGRRDVVAVSLLPPQTTVQLGMIVDGRMGIHKHTHRHTRINAFRINLCSMIGGVRDDKGVWVNARTNEVGTYVMQFC